MNTTPWGEPDRDYFWEASLTGDLVCGACGKTMIVDRILTEGLKPCRCGKQVRLLQRAIDLSNERARHAFPAGRPKEEGPKFKGESPYEVQ